MTDLLTDLTNASTGSRALSDRVLIALGWAPAKEIEPIIECGDPPYRQIWVDATGRGYRYEDRPNPTVNLQDAVNLVPDSLAWAVNADQKHGADALVEDESYKTWRSGASGRFTPALALCIALTKYMEKT